MPTPHGRHWTARTSAAATSGWTRLTIAAEVVEVAEVAEAEAAVAEAAVVLEEAATATSGSDLRRCAGDPGF